MVKDELNITVGARIRTIRENMGYTRERFSDLCDISDSFLSDVERGNKSLTTKTLYKICSSTNASADYILLGKSQTSASQKSKRDSGKPRYDCLLFTIIVGFTKESFDGYLAGILSRNHRK